MADLERTANERISIYPFTRSAAEIGELRRFCQLWSEGNERFWSFDDVLAALGRAGSLGYYAAAAKDGAWRGVLLADVGPFTVDLLYVYVLPGERRGGLGRQLMEQLIATLRERPQLEALLLEVRASNSAAQRLYEELGMQVIGRRKAYYADGEDALVMRLALGEEGRAGPGL